MRNPWRTFTILALISRTIFRIMDPIRDPPQPRLRKQHSLLHALLRPLVPRFPKFPWGILSSSKSTAGSKYESTKSGQGIASHISIIGLTLRRWRTFMGDCREGNTLSENKSRPQCRPQCLVVIRFCAYVHSYEYSMCCTSALVSVEALSLNILCSM